MLTNRRRTYNFYVGSALLPESLSIGQSANFYVDIKWAGGGNGHQTTMKNVPCWNEEFRMIGNALSIISLEIKQNRAESHAPDSYIGHVNIPLGTLLTICAGDEVALLKFTLITVKLEQPSTGFLTVQLSKLEDPAELKSLALDQIKSFDYLGELLDLENAIVNLREAVALIDDEHPDKPACLSNLGISQQTRFEHLGELPDLENAIANLREAVELIDNEHPNKPICLINLGINQQTRFEHLGELADLESAISNLREAVDLTDDEHPNKPGRLSNLGIGYQTRFELLGELPDVERAIDLTEDGHPSKPAYHSNLGISQQARFERLGELLDMESAIVNLREAVELTDDGHPDKPDYLMNLGISQQTRFQRLGELSDLKSAIGNQREAVELTDNAHPHKANCLATLGISQRNRFDRLGELADLESAISNLQEAIELTDDGHPKKPGRLSNLAISKRTRFQRLDELSDLESAIVNLQDTIELTDDGHPNKPAYLSNLGISQHSRFERLGELSDIESAIMNLARAIELTDAGHPDKRDYFMNLGVSQRTRFQRLGGLSDLESAIENLQEALSLVDDGHPDKPILLSNLGISQRTRFDRLSELSDLESAIANLQEAAELTDDGHPDKPIRLSNLGISQRARFQHLSELADLEGAIMNLREAVKLTDDGHADKPGRLSNLGISQRTRFQRLGEVSDIESAVVNLREAVNLTHNAHPEKPVRLSNLGISQHTRFQSLAEISDLESAIANQREAVQIINDAHPHKPNCLMNLGISQQTRFQHLGEFSDCMDAIASLKSAAQSAAAYPRQALAAARYWAHLSQTANDPSSALDAYRTAIEILPQVAWLGLDTSSRQRWLLEEQPENLGCLAATCAIRLGRFEEAVELLDLARSVFWQQASSIRGDLTDLRKAEHLELARDFERVGQALNASSFSDSSLLISDAENGGDRIQEHRRLVLEMESLIKRTRKLPGFEFFRKPTPFQQLRPIPGAGQVVIVNVSLNGADALIFDDRHPIQHVPLPDVDLETLTQQSRNFMLQRPSAATLKQQQNYVKTFLKPALRAIGEDIIEPIFNALGIPLQNTVLDPPSRRILWYLTGPLTFIPIHAAGPGGKGFDVSRLVISSYITTLASLLQAQKRHAEVALARPKLLAVSQPHTPGQTPLEKSTAEVENVIQMVSAAGWPAEDVEHLDGADAVVNRVSDALDTCSWVHFACHALQDNTEGMKSAFALHDGDLYLSMVASKRLSLAQLAFLSACQAASGMQGLPGEAMHLAAGIQFAGFLSVIATMWSIKDEDAIKVAEHTYGYLLRNGMGKIDLSEAAAALNHAVLRLREDSAVTVDRWAPFVHFGI